MTWGTKLLLVFAGFAILMSSLVYLCMKQNFELVSKDYYAEELRYQDKIDGMNNANKISAVSVEERAGGIAIQLPKEVQGLATTGQVHFYCPEDSKRDRKIELAVNDEGLMLIDKAKVTKANYVVKVNWQNGDKKYFAEQRLSVK